MTLEALLAYAHFLAILTLVVFISSEAALCRADWLNAKVVERLAVVDRIYGIAAGAVLLTGVARTWWGIKGTAWYWSNGLLHLKLALFVAVALMSIKPTVMFIRWRRELRASGSR
jgi:putative membrane protein